MVEIRLDGQLWKTKDDFYGAFLAAVGAPESHGRNLDALWDSITGGQVNAREIPYCVVINGLSHMGSEAAQMVQQFQELIEEAKRDGYPVEILVGPA